MVKSRSGYIYLPQPPPCVYQYLMNIYQLQCNFSAVVTKKMFISVHIYRVFITLGSIQVQKKLFKQCSEELFGLSINSFQMEPCDWRTGSFSHMGLQYDHPWSSLAIGLAWPYMVIGHSFGSSCFLIQTCHENPHSLSFELWYCKTMEKFGEGEDSRRLCFGGKEYTIIHGENRDNMYLIEKIAHKCDWLKW